MKTYLAEPELIKAIREHSRIGAEALYDQYAVIIFKVICCKTSDRINAERIFEETFLKVWRNIYDYRPQKERLLLWIIGIARGLVIVSPNLSVIKCEPKQLPLNPFISV